MIQGADKRLISQMFGNDNPIMFSIPRYQREYTWNKDSWSALFSDLYENDSGYFLGSVICVETHSPPNAPKNYEVIDGQQRITTISILFAAIYKILSSKKSELNDDQRYDLNTLQNRLIYKDGEGKQMIRLTPQNQGYNLDDYNAVLGDLGIFSSAKKPYAIIRKMFKAYDHFQNEINNVLTKRATENPIAVIFEILKKILNAVVVNIVVDNYSDAFIMFESLNNRGEPLSAIDLIKNSLLAQLGKEKVDGNDSYYQNWGDLLKYLGSDSSVQERFFRQYYNAFVDNYKELCKVNLATRSNLIRVYDAIIKDNAELFLEKILLAAHVYSHIIGNQEADDSDYILIKGALGDLDHIQGAPSYVLLLYLLIRQKEHKLTDDHLLLIIKYLVKFFVRRNITNIPATYELPSLFMGIIGSIKNKKGEEAVKKTIDILIERSPTEVQFKEKLKGQMYMDNVGVTRFILCYIEEQSMTKETRKDLWKQEKNKYVWTIEHIFPEGKNIPEHWVKMIANGNKERAEEIWASHVHKLGNLTVTGFNSRLSAKAFNIKRDLKDEKGKYIGYKNGLSLNSELAKLDNWNSKNIDDRTDEIINKSLELFKYE
jgi:uncharacterized protein with ParB-like and HNH nuclease domain